MPKLGGLVREPPGARLRTEFGEQQRNRRQVALQMPEAGKVRHERRAVGPLEGYFALIYPLCEAAPIGSCLSLSFATSALSSKNTNCRSVAIPR